MENIKPEAILKSHWEKVTDKPFCDTTLNHLDYVISAMREFAQIHSSEKQARIDELLTALKESNDLLEQAGYSNTVYHNNQLINSIIK